MPEAERLSYTVTPGPEVLAKMGTSWTLFTMPPVMFAVGPDGEPPEPAAVTMTAEQAADLTASGYVVEEALSAPEPVNDVQVSPGLEGVEPERVDEPVLVTYTAGPEEGEERSEMVAPVDLAVTGDLLSGGAVEVERATNVEEALGSEPKRRKT
jgi:hypothetical protein